MAKAKDSASHAQGEAEPVTVNSTTASHQTKKPTHTTHHMSSSSSSWEVVWFKTLLQTRGFWSSHDNGEGFVYYYNRQTRESTWQCPFREEETSEVFDVKKSAMDISGVWSMHESKKHGMVYYFNQNSGKSSWSRPVDFHLPLEHQISWEDVSSSSFAAQPTDKQIQEFYAMLDDKNITADSSWESVLPKIAYDRRFTAVSGYVRIEYIYIYIPAATKLCTCIA